MSNPLKGEVHFEHDGKTFTFKLGTNAQAMIEKQAGMPLSKFLHKDRLDQLGATDVRLIFWAGLFRQHKLTEEEVGDMIDDLGADRVAEIFLEAVESAAVKNTEGVSSRPPKSAKARTGMDS